MDRQRLLEVLSCGLTLCRKEISDELAKGLVRESERAAFANCCVELEDTHAKLRHAQAGGRVIADQAFWYNLDDALYALEEITPRFADARELEQVREGILHWQNELAAAHAAGCARTAA